MSKSLSATRERAPTTACSGSAPEDQVEFRVPTPIASGGARPSPPQRAPRRVVAAPPMTSNLGEPVGVFCWERDFLLALAADVLEEIVEPHDEEAE
jgi:hypothetical protein